MKKIVFFFILFLTTSYMFSQNIFLSEVEIPDTIYRDEYSNYVNLQVIAKNGKIPPPCEVSVFISDDNILHPLNIYATETIYDTITDTIKLNMHVKPEDLPKGNYQLTVTVDFENKIPETNEQDNYFTQKVYVKDANNWDLVAENLEILQKEPCKIYPGYSLSTHFYLTNKGTDTTRSRYGAIYLSTDTLLNDNSRMLRSLAQSKSLAPGEAYKINAYSIPINETPGEYYVIAIADHSDDIFEQNENNNTIFKQFTITDQADIYLDALATPSSMMLGAMDTLEIKVHNPDSLSMTSNVNLYLSEDNIFSNNDIKISDRNYAYRDYQYGGTDPGTITYTFSLPNVAVGTYYLIATINEDKEIPESNYGNNTVVSDPISVLAPELDLSVSNISLADTITAGVAESFSYTLRNINQSEGVNPWHAIYVSKDNILDRYDGLIDEEKLITPLADTCTKTKSFTLDNQILSGTYYLIIDVNSDRYFAETDYNNNVISIPFHVKSSATGMFDISVESIVVDDTISYLTTIGADCSNKGTKKSPVTVMNYYLSKDNLLDDQDIHLAYNENIPELDPGNNTFVEETNIIDPGISGNYYIICNVTQVNSFVHENVTSNNSLAIPVYCAPPSMDFNIFYSKEIEDTLQLGDYSQKLLYIDITGNTDMRSGYFNLSLTKDTTEESVIKTLKSSHFTNYSYKKYFYHHIDYTIPSDIDTGTYYVRTWLEGDFRFDHEAREFYKKVHVTYSKKSPDYEITDFSIVENSMPGKRELKVSVLLTNLSNINAGKGKLAFYLGPKDSEQFDEKTNVWLDTLSIDPIAARQSLTINGTLKIPSFIPGGDYTLYAYAKPDESSELNQENSTAGIALKIESNLDLMLSEHEVIANDTIKANDLVTMSASVKSSGTQYIYFPVLQYYYSVDDKLDNTDSLIYSKGNNIIFPDSSIMGEEKEFNLPHDIVEGKVYYIIIKASPLLSNDIDAGNNIYAYPLYTKGATSVLSQNDKNNGLVIYPNPAHETIYLSTYANEVVDVEIYDQQGRLSRAIENHYPGESITIGNLVPGVYLIKINAGNSIETTKLIIK